MLAKRFLILIGLVLIVFVSTQISLARPALAAGIWYVKTTGNDANDCQAPATACASLNGALAKPGFVAGDTIRVAIGTYTGSGDEVVLINKDVTLSGGWDATFTTQSGVTTIDGQGSRRGVSVIDTTNVLLERFTIQNGFMINGGGIYQNAGTLTISESNIINNMAGDPCCLSFYGGAGISGWGGILVIKNSTISRNALLGWGGSGIYYTFGSVIIVNSTISENSGDTPSLYVYGSPLTIKNSTIINNQFTGIYSEGGNATIQNTIAAGHPNTDCGAYPPLSSLGYNLIQKNSNCILASTDLTNTDPQLEPLQNYGGATLTHVPSTSSPAINAGNPSGCTDNLGNSLSNDQRGLPRTGRCDIGAVEMQLLDSSSKTFNRPIVMETQPVVVTVLVRNHGNTPLSNIFVTDTVPSALGYINGSLNASSGASQYNHPTVLWNGSINAGQIVTITYRIVAGAYRGIVHSPATISQNGLTITRNATLEIRPSEFYIPSVKRDFAPKATGIHGRVTQNGTPVAGLGLELRWYDGSTWSTAANVLTNTDGTFLVQGVPTLTAGQLYYVRYINWNATLGRLSSWGTRALTSYIAGDHIAIGDFDVADITLIQPVHNAVITLPYMFGWHKRSATLSDSYYLNLFNPLDTNIWWMSPPLGYEGIYWFEKIPAGFQPAHGYGWYVGVSSPDGGYGESLYYRIVVLYGPSASPSSKLPGKPSHQQQDRPQIKLLK